MPRPTIRSRSVLFTLAACLFCRSLSLADEKAQNSEAAPQLHSRQSILETAGLWPLPELRPGVGAVVEHRRKYSGYSVENVALETATGCYCTGNLYRPLLRHDLGPALLVVDELDAGRRYGAERQMLCAHLARLGVTVLACNTTWDNQDVGKEQSHDARSVHFWNSLRSIDFLATLERIDIKRIGVVATDGSRLKQIDNRITLAADQAGELSQARREAIYSLCALNFHLQPDPFYAESFAQKREPEPRPREEREKIKLESREELTKFDAEQKHVHSVAMTNEKANHIIADYLNQLRNTPPTKPAVVSLAGAPRAEYAAKELQPGDEALVFTPPGFDRAGVRKVASGPDTGRLAIVVRERATKNKTPCRINVVGPDGNYYEPEANALKEHSYSAEWPNAGWGNRTLRAPVRYLGRPFYVTGDCTVAVPAGKIRVEVWKGFEYRLETLTVIVTPGQTRQVEIALAKAIPMTDYGYWSGDPHIHFHRRNDDDQSRIFDLLECEDTHFGTILAYNEPAGPYQGLMKHLDSPQMFGLGRRSIATRGDYSIVSGQEYRSGHYGHLNLFMLDRLVLDGQSLDADGWPLFGLVARGACALGGLAFYAHGGYSQEIWADVAQGDVDGVELLQHGAYRGIGLIGWYRMLNTGFRVPANGAADYPACRMLSDSKTYVYADGRPTMEQWMAGMAKGKSFFTSGPLLLLEVDGQKPGAIIDKQGAATRVKVRIRVRSEVAPVTNVQLIANGRIIERLELPTSQGLGSWIELEHEVALTESAWIAARAFSLSPLGTPDAEAHTNPIYVYLNGKAPYDRESLDSWLSALDEQITIHRNRKFDGQAKVLDYFERSRDILTKIRAAGGIPSTGHPSDIAAELPVIDDATTRQHSDEELKAYLKPVPPKPFTEFLKTFDTVGGFEMQPVAREPQVYDPIAAAFDENGQLYVCEMRDYPYKPAAGEKPLGGVRLLKDVDGNGTFDESYVFAENLLWAGGVAPWRGGVFVAAPPDIWYLKDTDGDHHADIRRRVFTGFGTQNQQSMLNNLAMGLDHRIYGSTAGNGGKIRCIELPSGGKPASAPEVDINGRDFCFDPETGAFESITGTMQFGNSFDDWGNRFLCSESQPLLHEVLPQRYLVRNPYLSVPNAIQNIVPAPVPIFRTSPVERWRIIRSSRRIAHGERSANSPGASHHVIDAAAGVTVYRGGAYPAQYYGNVFVSDAQNNLIHRRTLKPDGVTFKSERADANTEFVRSFDPWFRPVNLVNAPDGTLYVLDMSREVLESIHVPSDVVKYLDLTSGRSYGRIFRLAPPGFRYPGPPHLGEATTEQLVAALESPHGWWRDTAHRLLYERQDSSATAPLRRMLFGSRLPQARLHALWSLTGLRALTVDDLTKAFGDEQAAIREHALRLSESRLVDSPALLEKVIAQAADPLPRIRFQVAFSLGESRDPRAAKALAQLARSSMSDPWIRTAILSSCSPLVSDLLTELLFDKPFAASADGRQFVAQLIFIVGARNQKSEVSRVLEQVVRAGPRPELSSTHLLAALGRGLKQSGARLEPKSDMPKASTAFLRDSFQIAHTTARDETSNVEQRQQAIELLGFATISESRKTLTDLLDARQTTAVQIAAVRALADYADADVSKLLLDRWPDYAPDVRAAVTSSLMDRPERTRQFLESASVGNVSLAYLDTAQRSFLIEHPDSVVRLLAKKVFANATASRVEVIAAYAKNLNVNADSRRGKAVFRRECMVCHKIGDMGNAVGPDLTSSAFRDGGVILVQVLDPNRDVPPKFQNYMCVDNDGRVTTGILTAQSATSITLTRQNSEVNTILRTNIEQLASTGKSLMPEGFERNITTEEMHDLIAFLQSSQLPEAGTRLDIGTTPGMEEPKR